MHGSATLKDGVNFGVGVNYSGETFDPYEGPEGHTYDDRVSFNAWHCKQVESPIRKERDEGII